MQFSPELIISVIIQLISIGVFIGVNKTTLDFMQEQIKDLKEDMRKYNCILERMVIVEQSTKASHHRIDTIEEMMK